jgi:alanine dehydrogenase
MNIGVPKEIKNHEYRVALTPSGTEQLINSGHKVYIEKNAGIGSGFSDNQYTKAGGTILDTPKEIYHSSDIIIKIKEPQPQEYEFIQSKHIVFTYFHFAASQELISAMQKSKATCIAYETVRLENGELPLLAPMSQIAGRIATQQGAFFLEKPHGGKGQLIGGVPGSPKGKVVVIGAGEVGTQAALIAAGMQANVELLDINSSRLRALSNNLPANITPLVSSRNQILKSLSDADLVIGAVLVPGSKAPKIILEKDLEILEPGSVIVDVAIDQGGCFETSKPTTHENPVYKHKEILHYCVTNMPGAVPKTATHAITNVTLRYLLSIANNGLEKAFSSYPELKAGLSIQNGEIIDKNILQ